MKADNGTSHVHSSSSVLNLPLFSHSLAREDPDKHRKEEESPQQERETERRGAEKKDRLQGFSHQPWPDFFLLLSSFCPSWLRVELFLKLSSCVCVGCFFFFHFSVLEVASPLLKSCLKPLVHTRGSEWEGMCRVKLNDCLFRIVNPAPLYKANSAYLLCLSKKEKPHPLIATHTRLFARLSLTLCWTGCVYAFWLCSLFLPLLCLTPPSSLHEPWRKGGN